MQYVRLGRTVSRKHIVHAMDDSLRRLGTGASSMYAWQFAKMLYLASETGTTRFASMQNHYNLIYREEEREMLPLCREEGIGAIPWSPLARRFLAGNRAAATTRARTDDYAQKLYAQEADLRVLDSVTSVAGKRGLPNAQVALAWVLAQPGITAPIVVATKMQHLNDAVAALDVTLSSEEMAELEGEYVPHLVLGHS